MQVGMDPLIIGGLLQGITYSKLRKSNELEKKKASNRS